LTVDASGNDEDNCMIALAAAVSVRSDGDSRVPLALHVSPGLLAARGPVMEIASRFNDGCDVTVAPDGSSEEDQLSPVVILRRGTFAPGGHNTRIQGWPARSYLEPTERAKSLGVVEGRSVSVDVGRGVLLTADNHGDGNVDIDRLIAILQHVN